MNQGGIGSTRTKSSILRSTIDYRLKRELATCVPQVKPTFSTVQWYMMFVNYAARGAKDELLHSVKRPIFRARLAHR